MPRPRKSKHIPRAAAQLAVDMHHQTVLQVPKDVLSVFSAVFDALSSAQRGYNSVATFNRVLAACRRSKPKIFATLQEWLSAPETIVYLASVGQSGNRLIWLQAVIHLQSGKNGLQAFATKPGPATQWKLPAAHALAAKVLELEKAQSTPTEKAIREVMAAHVSAGGSPDERQLRRCLIQLRKANPDIPTLSALSIL